MSEEQRPDSAWDAIVADLSADTELREGGRRLQINDPKAPDRFIEELLDEGPLASDAFVPPEPPPIPAPRDAVARFAWAAAIGGPILALAANALSWGSALTGAGVLAFVGGFVTLVARMDSRNRADDGDDGAVV